MYGQQRKGMHGQQREIQFQGLWQTQEEKTVWQWGALWVEYYEEEQVHTCVWCEEEEKWLQETNFPREDGL